MEVLQEQPGDLRRSPRLRERYSRERSEGPSLLAHSVAVSVTTRRGLSGYLRGKEHDERSGSILNESGQSVPVTFELGQDVSGSKSESTDASSRQTPPLPEFLFGLDDSEEEEEQDIGVDAPYTPHTRTDVEANGVVGWVFGGLMSVLFRLGSLLYLAATAILCLDVIILHRCYTVFTAATCWGNNAASRPWLRFWILPVVLCSLVAFLIGGGIVVPGGGFVPPSNCTCSVHGQLCSEITASIRTTLSKDIEYQTTKLFDKKIKEWVEARLSTELGKTDTSLEELKKEVNKLEATIVGEVLCKVDELERLLNETGNNSITETIVLQRIEIEIEKQLNTAKMDWLKLVSQEVSPLLRDSIESLRKELSSKDDQLSDEVAALKKLVDDNNTTLTESIVSLILDLQWASRSIENIRKDSVSHTSHLTTLKTEVTNLKSIEEEERRKVVERLEVLESAKLSHEDLAKAFQEEIEKSVSNNTSVIWTWLHQELDRSEGCPSRLTRKGVEQLIRVALDTYSADRVAKFDFALENSGGEVVDCSGTYPPALETYNVMGVPIWSMSSSPQTIIQPGVYPGDCWAMNGAKGYALIRLKEAAIVTGVTVEHIPKELTPSGSLSSAPREFRILGKNEKEPVQEGDQLGDFTYSIEDRPIQEFSVKDEGKAYTHILFDFISNHGNNDYTCIYRVRIHGRPATS